MSAKWLTFFGLNVSIDTSFLQRNEALALFNELYSTPSPSGTVYKIVLCDVWTHLISHIEAETN